MSIEQRAGRDQRVLLRPFELPDLTALVAFWNFAFADQRNFHPINAETFRRRVLDASATNAAGLILAWREDGSDDRQLVGIVHAFRPPPAADFYRNWTPNHYIALLYVHPAFRRQGIGSRLLQAAESWLYYCPVHFASQAQPVYGVVEGPRSPLFGSSERMGLSATNGVLIDFLAKRGYLSIEIGDVSMERVDTVAPDAPDFPPSLAEIGLQPIRFSHRRPFVGEELTKLPTVSQWGTNQGDPYGGVGLVDREGTLRGHLAWYPMAQTGKIALINFRVDPPLRGQGAGKFLLDWGLNAMISDGDREGNPVQRVEIHTHLQQNAAAVRLYRSRGFEVVDAWVNLVKT
ncbi:MAG: GNAT family N-acetyltransferase [Caldilineaceae bacterium]|nr:GNAT family N-acetyltransferase [Caldilineaceae bacterium]